MIYLIGALRNQAVPALAMRLRGNGFEVFDEWIAVGPEADDCWQAYEKVRGRTYAEALASHHARHVFEFDRKHLDRCWAGVLVLPAGKSAHLELGYLIGQGKLGYILLDGEPERFDIMYGFATKVCTSEDQLIRELHDAAASR